MTDHPAAGQAAPRTGPGTPVPAVQTAKGRRIIAAGGDPALLRSALALAARGWRVFPCVPGTKRPALRGNWQYLATTDPARIRRWWTRVPYNIGIACGTSLVILDLDIPNHTPLDGPLAGETPAGGISTLAALARQHGQPYPAATYTVQTPSGGQHLYFRADGSSVRNSAGRLGPCIDVRADGGYVIGPGSRASGGLYTTRNTTGPGPLPAWIAALLQDRSRPPADRPLPVPGKPRAAAYAMAALRDETRRVATAREGTRNNTLNTAAFNLGQLAAAGLLPAHQARTALTRAAAQAGLPDREARQTIQSGMTAGARFPRTPPETSATCG
jgi:hypothetical protein